ncbi:hypothetical protein IWW39_001806 [Coemansia spiralis]|uniref:UDENN domain-containing protein n=1 Tax=Coemansia spiralis TaxID=417178 RepID=A0A9W8GH98_9FUNG|nr:hypothetical protein IWW39_001806 [Coemansia spiralis]
MFDTPGTHVAHSGMPSEDEFYDCTSHTSASSTKPSLEGAVPAALSVVRSNAEGDNAGGDGSPESPKSQRFRSLTSSRVPNNGGGSGSGSSGGDGSHSPSISVKSTLRRSATTRVSTATHFSGSSSSLVEERARQAVRAMAEACTTGVSVREADERRSRAFSRLLVGRRLSNGGGGGGADQPEAPVLRSSSASTREGTRSTSNEDLSTKPRLKHIPLHHVSSHSRVAGLARTDAPTDTATSVASATDSVSLGSVTPEPESRTLSMTDDRKAVAITRSASLEARFDRRMRDSLANWVICFGSVHFDADQGPTLGLLYPHVPFSDTERAAICFSSMPDSTIYELYDSAYSFHFRVDPVRLGLPKDRIFLYGHVFFRQKRDPLMRRGGFQRSIVIISHLPYHGLFSRMVYMLGPLYFDLGTAILEAAAHNVTSWPAPGPGRAYELPFLGTALSVELPESNASQLLETSRFPLDRFDPGEHILASVTCDGLFRSFRDTLEDLWVCWELMILGEPLVVLADTPSRCSEAVVGLVDIIFPITYCGDYRPYFTIQDPDFRAIVSKTHVPTNTVVGVSNPFFSEALSHWPHKLYLGTSGRMSQMHGAAHRATVGSATSTGSSSSSNNNAGSSANGSGGSGSGSRQGLQSKYKCAVSKDRPFAEHLLNSLKTGKQSPWMVNNMLRRHFIDLTVQFLAPLNRYFSTLIPQVHSAVAMPLARPDSLAKVAPTNALSWFMPPSALRPWRTDDFMASLASFGISPQLASRHSTTTAADVLVSVFSGTGSSTTTGSGGTGSSSESSAKTGDGASAATAASSSSFLPWKGKKSAKKTSDEWTQLYIHFLKCGNFATWLAHRTNEAERALLSRFRQELGQGDVHAWCRGYDYPLGLDAQHLAAEMEALDLATMDLGQSVGGSSPGNAAATPAGESGSTLRQPHVKHVFYHGEAEDERLQAERHRQQVLRERQERLAASEQPVYGSDGSLVGYRRQAVSSPGPAPSASIAKQQQQQQQQPPLQLAKPAAGLKQLGQRITQARRAQHVMLQAAWQISELLGAAAMARIPLEHRKSGSGIGGSSSALHASTPSEAEGRALRQQLSILLEYMAASTGCLFLPLVSSDYARE